MLKFTTQTKTNIRNASIFIMGAIVTVIITKSFDKIIPSKPVILKQFTDTIKIVHDYKLPADLDNGSIRLELEAKIKNLELLNNYDKQIKERLKVIDNSSTIIPNLILTQKLAGLSNKGFIQENNSSYFSSECPDLNSKYIDLKIDFMNPAIEKEIACLRVNIYRFQNENSKDALSYVMEDFYEVKSSNNLIRINNNLAKGKYEIMFGFMFKNDLDIKYPKFYMKKCTMVKK